MNTRKRRIQLWNNNPKCHWCDKTTIDPYRIGSDVSTYNERRGIGPHNLATLDHVFPKLDENRRTVKMIGKPPPVVLACLECNQRRNLEQLADLKKKKTEAGEIIPHNSVLNHISTNVGWNWDNKDKERVVRLKEERDRDRRLNQINTILARKLAKKQKREERKTRENEIVAKIFGNAA